MEWFERPDARGGNSSTLVAELQETRKQGCFINLCYGSCSGDLYLNYL